jgi:hypothetical protein
MPRDSLKRREAKRVELLDNLYDVHSRLTHAATLEVCMKKITETLIFLLEEQCPKKKKH